METPIKEIITKITTEEEAKKSIQFFLKAYKKEGVNLRMEEAGSIVGRRIVLVFDYEDMS